MKPLSDAAVRHLQRMADWPDLDDTRYRLVEELGRGGMGVVYRARDEVLAREVAIKVLRAVDLPEDVDARLAREARILARLEHPGIVPVHDLGTLPDGRRYYVMRLVRGQPLDAWLAGGPSLRERIDLLLRVCDAVSFAHARGIIHRDLKPGNIMVGEFGEVLVLDWGVAKELGDPERRIPDAPTGTAAGDDGKMGRTAHGTVLGTEGYMAPEQARGDVALVDARSDVYALGALLHAVSGPGAPKPVRAVAERARAAEREERYPSVTALARDLTRYLDGEPVEAYRENPLERLGRLAARYRTPIVLVVAYLVMRALFIMLRP